MKKSNKKKIVWLVDCRDGNGTFERTRKLARRLAKSFDNDNVCTHKHKVVRAVITEK
jgi:thymidine phosphorylase